MWANFPLVYKGKCSGTNKTLRSSRKESDSSKQVYFSAPKTYLYKNTLKCLFSGLFGAMVVVSNVGHNRLHKNSLQGSSVQVRTICIISLYETKMILLPFQIFPSTLSFNQHENEQIFQKVLKNCQNWNIHQQM